MEINKRFQHEKLKKIRVFNGAQLKYLAFISMLIDHVNNALITPILDGEGFLLHLSNIFSVLGRIAFPIFVFFYSRRILKDEQQKKISDYSSDIRDHIGSSVRYVHIKIIF